MRENMIWVASAYQNWDASQRFRQVMCPGNQCGECDIRSQRVCGGSGNFVLRNIDDVLTLTASGTSIVRRVSRHPSKFCGGLHANPSSPAPDRACNGCCFCRRLGLSAQLTYGTDSARDLRSV